MKIPRDFLITYFLQIKCKQVELLWYSEENSVFIENTLNQRQIVLTADGLNLRIFLY